MSKLEKNIIALGIVISLLSSSCKGLEINKGYEIIEDDSSCAYARYKDGLIYIGDEEYILRLNPLEHDILVIDKRDSTNPDMKVISSYQIDDPLIRKNIIEVLQEYEKENPSLWDRTTESMEVEWSMHNIFYQLDYEKDRSSDVDFDNEDEEIYNNKVLKKLFTWNKK